MARPRADPRAAGRFAARRAGGVESACRPTPTGTRAFPPSPAATCRGRPPFRAGGRCAAGPGLVLDAGGGCLLGGPRQPAGRQSAEVRALSQARGPAQPHLPWPGRPEDAGHAIEVDWNVPALDRQRTEMLRNDRVGKRALALFQLGASTAAERELYAASLDADPRYIETVLAVAQKPRCPPCRCGSATPPGTSATSARLRRCDVPDPALAAVRRLLGRPRAGLRLHAPGIGLQPQGAQLCRRHGADAAHARHGAHRRHQVRPRACGCQSL